MYIIPYLLLLVESTRYQIMLFPPVFEKFFIHSFFLLSYLIEI